MRHGNTPDNSKTKPDRQQHVRLKTKLLVNYPSCYDTRLTMQTPYRAITCASEIISPERQGSKEQKNAENKLDKSQVERVQLQRDFFFQDNGKLVVEVRNNIAMINTTQYIIRTQCLLIGSFSAWS